jgi:ribose transport system ATP-binding protein
MSIVEVHGLFKTFGGTQALRGASFSAEAGSIHGIVGPNGAGKSTLVRALCGLTSVDAGEIIIGGVMVLKSRDSGSVRKDVALVAQEVTLPESLTVAEAVHVGYEPRGRGRILSPSRMKRAAASALEEVGLEVSTRTLVSRLSGREKRLLMFAQALHRNASVVVVDEPTAALDEADAEIVLSGLEALRRPDSVVLFVSHRLHEVQRICDRVTGFRDGRDVATLEREMLTPDALEELILGERLAVLSSQHDSAHPAHEEDTETCLSIRGLSTGLLRGVSLELRRGEVLGVVGLAGSGAEDLLEVIGGSMRPASGQLFMRGRPVVFRGPKDALKAGIAYLPADRARAGLLDATVRENVAMPSWERIRRMGLLTTGMEDRFAREILLRLGLEQYRQMPLGHLSGGNRQKALFARAVACGARILVLGEPTAGVDVRGRRDTYDLIEQLAEEGYSFVILSSEAEEHVRLCDVVVTLVRGKVSSVLRGSELDIRTIELSMVTAKGTR